MPDGEDGPLINLCCLWVVKKRGSEFPICFKGSLFFRFVLVPWSWHFFVFEDVQPPADTAVPATAEPEDWLADGVRGDITTEAMHLECRLFSGRNINIVSPSTLCHFRVQRCKHVLAPQPFWNRPSFEPNYLPLSFVSMELRLGCAGRILSLGSGCPHVSMSDSLAPAPKIRKTGTLAQSRKESINIVIAGKLPINLVAAAGDGPLRAVNTVGRGNDLPCNALNAVAAAGSGADGPVEALNLGGDNGCVLDPDLSSGTARGASAHEEVVSAVNVVFPQDMGRHPIKLVAAAENKSGGPTAAINIVVADGSTAFLPTLADDDSNGHHSDGGASACPTPARCEIDLEELEVMAVAPVAASDQKPSGTTAST